jgi:aspartate kinase
MKVFKFGGASVKDANGVRNLLKVIELTHHEQLLVIVSAMGKTTNTFENVVDAYFNFPKRINEFMNEIKSMHFEIINSLFQKSNSSVTIKISNLFNELNFFLKSNKNKEYSFVYDQVVGFGELFSTIIIHQFLNNNGYPNEWLDSRSCVKTDSYFRDANLDWYKTENEIKKAVKKNGLTVTQGFIGSNSKNHTTTLGREGSDYSAAIFAYALDAESVTIWKDVPGVLNGDPRVFDNTILLNQISYREAIELAFYGASVIHPKTLQPLQKKEIPLYVKSFKNPNNTGTKVSKGKALDPNVPCFILKKNLVLLKLSSLNFSFIVEENISEIFSLLHKFQMRVELIQNSAISFSVCLNNKYYRLSELITELNSKFKVTIFENVELYTIRHFNNDAISSLKHIKEKILLEQRAENTLQVVLNS